MQGPLRQAATEHRHSEIDHDIAVNHKDQFERSLNQDGLNTRSARHMSRRMRNIAVLLFALIDVVAFRVAIAFMLDAPEDTFGRIETTAFALISFGIVLGSAYGAEKLRYWLDARAAFDSEFTDAIDAAAARRDLMFLGLPALVLSGVMLIAASIIRIMALGDSAASPIVWVVVPIFSMASLLGAIVTELKFANLFLDKKDDFDKRCAKLAKRHNINSRKVERQVSRFDEQAMAIQTLWSAYEPGWVLQADVCGQRIARQRAMRSDLFHPFGPDIKPMIEERLKVHSRKVNAAALLDSHGLDTTKIVEEARASVDSRRTAVGAAKAGVNASPLAPPVPPAPEGGPLEPEPVISDEELAKFQVDLSADDVGSFT
jgi:hypothetical protein